MDNTQRQEIINVLQSPKLERGFEKTLETAAQLAETAERVEARLIESLGSDALYTYPMRDGTTATMTIDKIWPICGAPIATLPEMMMLQTFVNYFKETSNLNDDELAASLQAGNELAQKYQ